MGQSPSIPQLDDQTYQQLALVGLSQPEITELYHVFNQLQPDKQKAQLKVETIKQLYKDSYFKPKLDEQFAKVQVVSFQEFCKVMIANISENRQKFAGNIEFENGNGEQAGCFLCPYAIDKGPQKQSIA